MPKTTKKVFTYFRFETDHFYDTKVKRLKNKFGMEDWGVFHFIVNEIYRVEGCYMVMDADGLFDISDYSRMDEKKVSDIIDYCAELGLFNKELWQDKQILTSEEIQELYVDIIGYQLFVVNTVEKWMCFLLAYGRKTRFNVFNLILQEKCEFEVAK